MHISSLHDHEMICDDTGCQLPSLSHYEWLISLPRSQPVLVATTIQALCHDQPTIELAATIISLLMVNHQHPVTAAACYSSSIEHSKTTTSGYHQPQHSTMCRGQTAAPHEAQARDEAGTKNY